MWAVLLFLAATVGLLASRRRRRGSLPASAVIVSPRKSTVTAEDGTVRSVQSAELTLSRDELERLWAPSNLENLARTYWLFLSRVTFGLIRVRYRQDERAVVFLARPLTLLRFEAPEYVIEADHGKVIWRIRDGLLVARAGRGSGYLALDVRRLEDQNGGELAKIRIEVEVANFYSAIASGFSMPVYEATQSAIHVLVTHAFLRSLAKLKLARSKVGRLRWLTGAQAVTTRAARARRPARDREGGRPALRHPERRSTQP
ncbi:MAG: hypothetical protein ACJ764_01490 [Solirubrobacteraceae bacterium]